MSYDNCISMENCNGRNVKGVTFVDLVKFLRKQQKTTNLPLLTPTAGALLETRILIFAWYPLKSFLELLKITDKTFLKGNESNAMEMGAVSGMNQLRSVHKAYVKSGDPTGSVIAMRHSWRSSANFGDLGADIEDDHSVVFILRGYDDLGMIHGMMIAGWGVAAARLAGSPNANAELIDRPWKGASRFCYRIRF